jgi:hypothetical protein
MSLTNSPTIAKPSIAYFRDHRVKLAGGIHCLCGRELRAHDLIITDRNNAEMICSGCHTTIAEIERLR